MNSMIGILVPNYILRGKKQNNFLWFPLSAKKIKSGFSCFAGLISFPLTVDLNYALQIVRKTQFITLCHMKRIATEFLILFSFLTLHFYNFHNVLHITF